MAFYVDVKADYIRPANPYTVTPVRLAIQTCEKTCKKFALNVSRHDNADYHYENINAASNCWKQKFHICYGVSHCVTEQ